MNTIFKFIFGAIIMGGALSMLAMGFAFIMIWWMGFAGSFFIMMIPFFIIGGIVGVETLD